MNTLHELLKTNTRCSVLLHIQINEHININALKDVINYFTNVFEDKDILHVRRLHRNFAPLRSIIVPNRNSLMLLSLYAEIRCYKV